MCTTPIAVQYGGGRGQGTTGFQKVCSGGNNATGQINFHHTKCLRLLDKSLIQNIFLIYAEVFLNLKHAYLSHFAKITRYSPHGTILVGKNIATRKLIFFLQPWGTIAVQYGRTGGQQLSGCQDRGSFSWKALAEISS